MSIGIEFIRRPNGWRVAFDRQLDLTNWDLEYTPDKIRCTPRPIEFLIMAFGAIFFIGMAVVIAIMAVSPSTLWSASRTPVPSQAWKVGDNFPHELLVSQIQSKFTDSQKSDVDVQMSTELLLETLTKDMSAEQKAQFLSKIDDQARERSRSTSPTIASRFDGALTWLSWLGRVFAILPFALCSVVGGACMVRAIRYARDRIELSVLNDQLVFQRPKVFGGLYERTVPLNVLVAISCYSVLRPHRHRRPGYVQWFVQLIPTSPSQSVMEFDIEHLNIGADRSTPPPRVRDFAIALKELSGLRVLVRRPPP